MEAPPVDRIERRYSLDEIRYSPSVRQLMPSIDVNTITFETGSWEIPPDQAARLQVIADGLNRAIARNPREVFLIEGHTDAVGNPVDNLSLSDRRAESAATLLTQQFGVPAENLTSQGYGSQYLKEQTDGPSRINRRVTVRRITPLLNGGVASLPPPPPGIAPPR
jgi:outer membrane protein OmpA-like peptidoglycan-associated protein